MNQYSNSRRLLRGDHAHCVFVYVCGIKRGHAVCVCATEHHAVPAKKWVTQDHIG